MSARGGQGPPWLWVLCLLRPSYPLSIFSVELGESQGPGGGFGLTAQHLPFLDPLTPLQGSRCLSYFTEASVTQTEIPGQGFKSKSVYKTQALSGPGPLLLSTRGWKRIKGPTPAVSLVPP